jgi:hypothetical protein
MTDQNSLARAYSSDMADDDPLAELARIVAGEAQPAPPQRRSVVTPTLPKQLPVQARTEQVRNPEPAPAETTLSAPAPAEAAAPVRRAVVTPTLDLEDALLAELGIAGEKPAKGAVRPAAAPSVPPSAGKSSARPASRPAPATRASLEDELLAELGFGGEIEAPALDDVPVSREQVRQAQPVRPAAPSRAQPAAPQHSPRTVSRHDGAAQAFDEFDAILNPDVDPHVEVEAPQAVPAQPVARAGARSEGFRLPPKPEAYAAPSYDAPSYDAQSYDAQSYDAQSYDDGLDDAIQAVHPVARPASDPLKSFDFGSAFEAEVKQLEVTAPPSPPPLPPISVMPRAKQVPPRRPVAAPPAPEPAAAVPASPEEFELPAFDEPAARKPERFELPAFEEPAPAPAPQPRMLTERELDDHFASAFAEELDLGLQRREPAPQQAFGENAAESRQIIVDERAFEAALDLESALEPEPEDTRTVQQAYRERAERIADDGDFEAYLGQAAYDPTQDWGSDPAAMAAADETRQDLGRTGAQEPRAASRPGSFRLAATALAGALVLGLAAVAYGFFSGGGEAGAPVVVRADGAPVKVKPENPGGAEIANQDQAAYDKVAGAKPDGTQQEQLVTAAEQPVEIAPAEIAKVAEEPVAAAPQGAEAAGTGVAAAAAADGKAEERLAPGTVETTAAIPTLAPRRVKTLTIKPDGTVVPAAQTAAAPATQETAFAAPAENATLPGVEIGAPLATEGATNNGSGSEQAVSPIDTASVTPDAAVGNGEWAVQLASQRSAEDAQATFQNLKQKFPNVLDGKPMSVQRAEVSGKGVFYRVRVPTQTKEEAVALCDELKSAGGSCFITR